jgi:hypothetical protein
VRKPSSILRFGPVFLAVAFVWSSRPALAQSLALAASPARSAGVESQTGNIEFNAQITPTGARPAPARDLTFYLLHKSLEDIRREVTESDPPPVLAKFVDSLDVSPELKDWMKKHQTVQLGGADFNKSLGASDIVDIPEFFMAYLSHAADFSGIGFPKPKFKEKDRIANPEKYKREKEEYKQAVSKFITAVPDSAQGLDVDLNDINPYERWMDLVGQEKARVAKRTFELAQTRELITQTDTNLDGRGAFAGLAPGEYWIATLDRQAIAGDVRLGWNVHVTVRAGEVTRVELNNLNAALP